MLESVMKEFLTREKMRELTESLCDIMLNEATPYDARIKAFEALMSRAYGRIYDFQK